MSGRIKGAAFREFIGWLRGELGGDALDALVARMPPAHAKALQPGHPHLGVLAATWYDAPMLHSFLDELARGRTRAEQARLATEGSRAALSATLGGIHRALLRVVGSPELHARFAQKLWETYYDSGRVTSERVARTQQKITYRAWRAHHPFLCAVTTASDLVIFAAMGLGDVRVAQLSCVSEGGEACAHSVEWAG